MVRDTSEARARVHLVNQVMLLPIEQHSNEQPSHEIIVCIGKLDTIVTFWRSKKKIFFIWYVVIKHFKKMKYYNNHKKYFIFYIYKKKHNIF